MRTIRASWVAAGLALAAGLSAPSRLGTEPQTADSPLAVIDAHAHANFDSASSLAELQKQWRDAGVTGAVIHRAQNSSPNSLLKSERVVQCAGVGETVDASRLEADFKNGAFQCVKIYLGYVYKFAYDPVYRPVYEIAGRHRAPVVFHTGDTSTSKGKLKYADPLTIDEVAVDFPQTNFVIAHCGNPWIESAAEVAYKNPNVYIECSAMLIGDLSTMPSDKVDAYVVKPIAWVFGYLENPRKMMFGTDYPLNKIKPYLDAYKKAIPPEHWQAVFHDNAARLFRFSNQGN